MMTKMTRSPFSSPPPFSPARSLAAWLLLASVADKDWDSDEDEENIGMRMKMKMRYPWRWRSPVSVFSSSLESWTSFSLASGAHREAPEQRFSIFRAQSVIAYSTILTPNSYRHHFSQPKYSNPCPPSWLDPQPSLTSNPSKFNLHSGLGFFPYFTSSLLSWFSLHPCYPGLIPGSWFNFQSILV